MTRSTVTCLSVRQPWAWLLAHGLKDVENRTWPTSHRGDTVIHTGQVFDREGHAWVLEQFPQLRPLMPAQFELGGAVGRCQILRCTQASESPWFCGPYGFVVIGAQPMPFVPFRGRLGFWQEPITDALHSALRDAAPAGHAALPRGQGSLFG